MRIGLFAHRLAHPQATGIGRYVRELVLALARVAPHEQLILASTPEDEPPDWAPDGVEQHVVPWPRRPAQLAWCLGAGPRLERGLGPLGAVHLLHAFPPVPTEAPLVATVHDLFPLEQPDWYRRSERWTYRRSVALVVRRASRLVVPSRYVCDRLVSVLGVSRELVEVVPQGVSGAFSSVRSADQIAAACERFGVEQGSFVVSVGAVSTRKNVLALVRGIAGIGARVPLVLVGADGHGAAEVDAEIARLNGAARVIRTGYLSDRDAAALVRGAGVLAHPALAEGFGMVPLEAMAAGTPVVASGTSSIPEVVGEAAVLVSDPSDARSWTNALKELMGSRERRSELAAAGEVRARDFSWERSASRMLEIYKQVAGGRAE